MAYVEGFVTPVPKKNLAKYRKSAKKAAKVFLEYGALEYTECLGDNIPKGKVTSFPMSVKLKPTEVVCFSWVVFKNKGQRNKVMKAVMKDPRFQNPDMMPFDGMRMIYGSFKTMVSMTGK